MPDPAKMLNTDPMSLVLAGGLPAVLSRASQGKLARSGQAQLNEMSKKLVGHHPMDETITRSHIGIAPAKEAGKKLLAAEAAQTGRRKLTEEEIRKISDKIAQNDIKALELNKAISDANNAAGTQRFTAKALIQEKLDEINIENAKLKQSMVVHRKEAADAKAMGDRGAELEAKDNLFRDLLEKADNDISIKKVDKAYNDTLKKLNEAGRPSKQALQNAQYENERDTKLLKLSLQKAKDKLDKTEFLDPTLREIFSDVDDSAKFIKRIQDGTVDDLRAVLKTLPNEADQASVKAALVDDFFSRGYDPKTGQQSKLAQLWFPTPDNANSFKGKFAEMYGAEKADKMERILGRIKQLDPMESVVKSVTNKALYWGAVGLLLKFSPSAAATTGGGAVLYGLMKYNKAVEKLLADPKAYEQFIKYTDKQVIPTAAGKIPAELLKIFKDSAIPMTAEQVGKLDRAARETPAEATPDEAAKTEAPSPSQPPPQ